MHSDPGDIAAYLRYLSRHVPSLDCFPPARSEAGSTHAEEWKTDCRQEPLSRRVHPAPIAALKEQAIACMACPLSKTRNHVVFGEGSEQSGLMFVGEGPGAEEDRTGRPFVGKAGELLTKMIQAMGLSREAVYIANTVKCRPPGNRVPTPEERSACFHFLDSQIHILQPRFMILLGQTASQVVLGRSEGITRLRGQMFLLPDYPGLRVLPTYHPAYLLRNPSAKKEVWEDLKTVMGWMGLGTGSQTEGR